MRAMYRHFWWTTASPGPSGENVKVDWKAYVYPDTSCYFVLEPPFRALLPEIKNCRLHQELNRDTVGLWYRAMLVRMGWDLNTELPPSKRQRLLIGEGELGEEEASVRHERITVSSQGLFAVLAWWCSGGKLKMQRRFGEVILQQLLGSVVKHDHDWAQAFSDQVEDTSGSCPIDREEGA